MGNRRLAIFGGLLILSLVFLVGALRGTEFRGGRSFPSPDSSEISFPTPGTPPSGEWLIDLFRLGIFLGLLLAALALLFSRNFRRHAFYLLVAFAILLFLWYSLSRLPLSAEREAPLAGPSQGGGEGEVGEERVPPRAPSWAIYVASLLVALGLALWLGPRLALAFERKHKKRAIQGVAQEAVAELKEGLPVTDVVLRAWLRMVEILSARSGHGDRPHFTPREFAENMARLGFRHEAVEVLTRLFEEVRYGHKESETRREEAISALSALERAFA